MIVKIKNLDSVLFFLIFYYFSNSNFLFSQNSYMALSADREEISKGDYVQLTIENLPITIKRSDVQPSSEFDFIISFDSKMWVPVIDIPRNGKLKLYFPESYIVGSVQEYFGPYWIVVDSYKVKKRKPNVFDFSKDPVIYPIKNNEQEIATENQKNQKNTNYQQDLTKNISLKNNIGNDNRMKPIASLVTKQIALSICPNTAKDATYYIFWGEDKGDYILLDLMSQWTGSACRLGCPWETYYTKEKVYINKSNYEIFKIENYYQSDNVSQVWSTSEVLAAFAAIGMGAVILSSGDDTKKSSTSTTSSSSSSSSSKPTIRTGERIKDGVEIVSWSSRNGILTAGNNDVRVRLRNKNTYDVIVRIELLNNSGQWERNYKDIHIRAGGIVDVETLGKAWEESKDIGIYSVE